jgi:hypothetical protein
MLPGRDTLSIRLAVGRGERVGEVAVPGVHVGDLHAGAGRPF